MEIMKTSKKDENIHRKLEPYDHKNLRSVTIKSGESN